MLGFLLRFRLTLVSLSMSMNIAGCVLSAHAGMLVDALIADQLISDSSRIPTENESLCASFGCHCQAVEIMLKTFDSC